MTKEKANAIIGRLMREYSDAKHQVNLHEKALRELADKVEPLAWILRRGETDRLLELLKSVDFAEMSDTAENLKVARTNVEKLGEELRGCGVNI